jgi:pimeloyl-ACP methyl ester carboxylesterase
VPPTIVLVHGAFADSGSWDAVIDQLPADHRVIAAANPLVGEETVLPVPRSDGTTDFYIAPDSFHEVFCADLPAAQAARMAASQRPATQEALTEPSGDRSLWNDVPSWFLIGELDRVIPAELQHYEAKRARAHREIEVPGASHVAMVSHPAAVAKLIVEACALVREAV